MEWNASGPVDLPPPRVEPMLPRRRHRTLTGISGAVLFACLFLPAVKGCGEPVYPVEMPMFLHPYLFGVAFAIGAGAVTARGLRTTIAILRVLSWLAVAGGLVMAIAAPPIGIVELILGGILIAAIDTRGYSERRAAISAIIVGAGSTIWFGLWATSPDALIGVYLSLVGAIGLT